MFYIKVNGVIYEVKGTRTIPKTWSLSCEHTSFKGMCIKCVKHFADAVNPKLTGKKYITNWQSIQFLS